MFQPTRGAWFRAKLIRRRPVTPVAQPRKSNFGIDWPGGAAGTAMESGMTQYERNVKPSALKAVAQNAHGHPIRFISKQFRTVLDKYITYKLG